MIDFWEAIGRLATYKDLNNEFLKVLPPVGVIPQVSAKTYDSTGVGLDIPQAQYEAIQTFFAPILSENYLSLMAAGELIWTYSYQKSRDAMNELIKLTSQATPELFGPSTRYFITLGIVIVDDIFRHNLQNKQADAVKVLLRLSDLDNDQITNLANDPRFEAAATAFSKIWDEACNDLLHYRPGHLHPMPLSTGGWQSGKETPPAGTDQYAASSASSTY
jgi:hypothetical protein